MQLNKSRQRRVCNPQLVAVWKQTVGLYGINPKERYTLRVMPYAYGDYMLAHARLHCQSFGLDRKKHLLSQVLFSGSPCWVSEDKTMEYRFSEAMSTKQGVIGASRPSDA